MVIAPPTAVDPTRSARSAQKRRDHLDGRGAMRWLEVKGKVLSLRSVPTRPMHERRRGITRPHLGAELPPPGRAVAVADEQDAAGSESEGGNGDEFGEHLERGERAVAVH